MKTKKLPEKIYKEEVFDRITLAEKINGIISFLSEEVEGEEALKKTVVNSIEFPGGRVKLLDGYMGEFQIEFHSKGEEITPQKPSWESEIFGDFTKSLSAVVMSQLILRVRNLLSKTHEEAKAKIKENIRNIEAD